MSCNRPVHSGPRQTHALRALALLGGIVLAITALAPVHAATSTTPTLTGTWRSAPEELPVATAFEESVWGKHARKIRTVEMTFAGAGQASLTIARRVVDARGRTVSGSESVETATIRLESATKQTAYRSDFTTTVERAERRYPDDPGGTWTLDGMRITVSTFPDEAGAIEVRVDYPEGRGSFWETLRRGSRTSKAAAARS